MIILILTIVLLVIGIACIIHYENNYWDVSENYLSIGMTLTIVFGVILVVEVLLLLLKPIDYKNFKIKYETISELSTSSEDVRDATYTMQLIDINNEIRINKEFINNNWTGIFFNKDIANMELLYKQ